jgi:hypothetical protein
MSDWIGYEEYHYWQCNQCLGVFPVESQIKRHLRKGECHDELMQLHKDIRKHNQEAAKGGKKDDSQKESLPLLTKPPRKSLSSIDMALLYAHGSKRIKVKKGVR